MATTIVKIDTLRITDWDSFHAVFEEALGFPDYYGRNMDAWIDCMTSLDEPEEGLTKIHVARGGLLLLDLEDVSDLAKNCPEIYQAILECSAFVNYRRIVVGEAPILALSFFRQKPQ